MARILNHEKRKPPGDRAKCTHLARLAECGDADMVLTAKLWDRLPPHTHAEAQRILLGAQLTSCRNLCNLKPCEDGDFIRDTVSALIGQGRECLFCKAPRGSRAHWSHECPASRSELEQKERNVAASLAFMGYCFWFDPLARWLIPVRHQDLIDLGARPDIKDPTLLVAGASCADMRSIPRSRRLSRGYLLR